MQVYRWAVRNGFNFSPTKTVSMHFTKLKGVFSPLTVKMRSHPIPQITATKLLGMTLDTKLFCIPHLKHLKHRCLKGLDILKCLSRKTCGANRSRLLHIYRARIRAKIDYGCSIYASATKTSLFIIRVYDFALEHSGHSLFPAFTLKVENRLYLIREIN